MLMYIFTKGSASMPSQGYVYEDGDSTSRKIHYFKEKKKASEDNVKEETS